jgi:hypothetical protein
MDAAALYTVRYYSEKLGRWRGRYRFAIVDWPAFRAARLGWFGRATLWGLLVVQRVLGRLTMETQLAAEAGPVAETLQVVHYTWIKKFGVTLYRSREVFTLHDHGREVAIARAQAYGPLFRAEPTDVASAVADPPTGGMVYDWKWFDRRLCQATRTLDADRLELVQTCDYCRAEAILQRFER